ncbi:homocysteine biosynthesis protein [bacterium]|nr:homocysteine biosynthesis protein [bacterium]
MAKSYEEINEKIKSGKAVVLSAEEVIEAVKQKGLKRAAQEVDVVTTGTFGAMCSSGAFLNFGHSKPKIKAAKVQINGVEAYSGIAAVDCYIGATKRRGNDLYGGGHVIHDLVSGKEVEVFAESDGTDCYPNQKIKKRMALKDFPDAFLFCPRNGYQNYNCAVNMSSKTVYTYMGALKPDMANASYSGAGQLSPLMNDPYFKTIGIGTRIFLGGGIGYVAGPGTQHNPSPQRGKNGVPVRPAGTLAVTGDLKQMSGDFLKGTFFKGYGPTLMVGLGIPIPILNEEILGFTAVSNKDIIVPVVDYGYDYPNGIGGVIGEVTVSDIEEKEILVKGKRIPCVQLSNIKKARQIAATLKKWIENGQFLISQPAELIPSSRDVA